MKIGFSELVLPKSGTVVAFVQQDRKLSPAAQDLDQRTSGMIARAFGSSRFVGKKDETLAIVAPAGLDVQRILLVGTGPADKFDTAVAEGLGATVYAALAKSGETDVAVMVDTLEGVTLAGAEIAAHMAYGAQLRSYRFDKYRTKEKPEQKPSLKKLTFAVKDNAAAKKAFGPLDEIAEGVFLTRDLVSEPPNIIYPETLAERCQELFKQGVEVEVLDEKKMKKLGMGALLGVAQGSAFPPQLVIMRYNGDPSSKEGPLAFVGKGVTFDTGGISIKPAAGMEDMKWDMAGAGAVIGLMRALAGRKAKVNVVGVVGLVENMPSGTAQRPGDIVTSMSGQTIEVLNTDAEGRLVLADALWYTETTLKPRLMIDLATLTGAIIVALGSEHAGLFASDDTLANQLLAAGRATGETLWQMPMGDAYDKDLDSDAADVKNIGSGRNAGSTLGAQFLKRFVQSVPWAHLDIAGTAWSKADKGVVPKGGTGYGVRLLDRFVADNYEAKS